MPTRLLYEIEHPDSISAIAFDVIGEWLATGSSNGEARVWDAATGKARSPILSAPEAVTAMVLLPAERRLMVSSEDKRVRLWDIDAGQMIIPPLVFEAQLKKLIVKRDLIQVESEFMGWGGTIDYLAIGPDRRVGQPTRDGWQRAPELASPQFGQEQTIAWQLATTEAAIEDLVAFSKLVSSQMVDELGRGDTLPPGTLISVYKTHMVRGGYPGVGRAN